MARATTKKATLAAGGYVGKEALTIARRANGTQVYVYRGQDVPADIPEAEQLRLAEGGYIVAKPAPAKPRQTARPAASTGTTGATDDDAENTEGSGDGDA